MKPRLTLMERGAPSKEEQREAIRLPERLPELITIAPAIHFLAQLPRLLATTSPLAFYMAADNWWRMNVEYPEFREARLKAASDARDDEKAAIKQARQQQTDRAAEESARVRDETLKEDPRWKEASRLGAQLQWAQTRHWKLNALVTRVMENWPKEAAANGCACPPRKTLWEWLSKMELPKAHLLLKTHRKH